MSYDPEQMYLYEMIIVLLSEAHILARIAFLGCLCGKIVSLLLLDSVPLWISYLIYFEFILLLPFIKNYVIPACGSPSLIFD